MMADRLKPGLSRRGAPHSVLQALLIATLASACLSPSPTAVIPNLEQTLDDVGVMARMLQAVEAARGDEQAVRDLIAKLDLYGRNTEAVLKQLQSGRVKQGPSIYSSLTPQVIQATLARLRASDELARITGQFEPGMPPEFWARTLGSLRYNSSEAGSPAFNTAYNDWLNQHYWTRWVPPSSVVVGAGGEGGGGMEVTVPGYFTERQWTPEGIAALKAVRPGHLEEDLVQIFGGPGQTFAGYWTEPAYGGWIPGQTDARRQEVATAQQQLFQRLGIGTGRLPQAAMKPGLLLDQASCGARPALGAGSRRFNSSHPDHLHAAIPACRGPDYTRTIAIPRAVSQPLTFIQVSGSRCSHASTLRWGTMSWVRRSRVAASTSRARSVREVRSSLSKSSTVILLSRGRGRSSLMPLLGVVVTGPV